MFTMILWPCAHLQTAGARAHMAAQEPAQLRLPRMLPRHRHHHQVRRRRRRLLLPLTTAACWVCDGRLTLCATCWHCQQQHLVWPPVHNILHETAARGELGQHLVHCPDVHHLNTISGR